MVKITISGKLVTGILVGVLLIVIASAIQVNVGDNKFFVGSNGNVGIGTTTPEAKLTIQGSYAYAATKGIYLRDGDETNYHSLLLGSNGNSEDKGVPANAYMLRLERGGGYGYPSALAIGTKGNSNGETPIYFVESDAARMIIKKGNIGIGTTSPENRLTVQNVNGGDSIVLRDGDEVNNHKLSIGQKNGVREWGVPANAFYMLLSKVGGYGYPSAFVIGTGKAVDTNTPLIFTTRSAERMKIGGDGNLYINSLAGSGNAYACVDSSGKLYRSLTACR